MLFVSLILSLILVLRANTYARREGFAGAKIVGLSVACAGLPLFCLCLLPAVAAQGVLLSVATVVWRLSGKGPAFFGWLSVGATVVAYGVAGWLVIAQEQTYARLRSKYPYESMQARLPNVRPGEVESPLAPEADQSLSAIEAEFSRQGLSPFRTRSLERLHEHQLELFVNSPGFGATRTLLPSESTLAYQWASEPVPGQPGRDAVGPWSPGGLQEPPGVPASDLRGLLNESILQFVRPDALGYFKDRDHVAGFEAHRFNEIPRENPTWKIDRLSLVGLLLSETPRVYESERLPEMDKVRTLPTRALNRFEEFALHELRGGKDLVATQDGSSVRMLGSVRNFERCAGCHGGKRGDLLGAFSYVLRTDVDQRSSH